VAVWRPAGAPSIANVSRESAMRAKAQQLVPNQVFNYHRGIFSKGQYMIRKSVIIRSLCLAAALAPVALGTACIHRAYRAYDPYYNDYHKWTDREEDYYQRWCRETQRDPGRDFRKLSPEDQEVYWKWRHQESDRKGHKNQ